MCMPHQKPTKPQPSKFRSKDMDPHRHQPLNRDVLERGDKNFKDERKKKEKTSTKKGFLAKLFS